MENEECGRKIGDGEGRMKMERRREKGGKCTEDRLRIVFGY